MHIYVERTDKNTIYSKYILTRKTGKEKENTGLQTFLIGGVLQKERRMNM